MRVVVLLVLPLLFLLMAFAFPLPLALEYALEAAAGCIATPAMVDSALLIVEVVCGVLNGLFMGGKG